MKISSLLKMTTVITIILSIITAGSLITLSTSINESKKANSLQLEYKQLTSEILAASDYQTNEVRAYSQYGNDRHYNNYWKEVNETKTIDNVIKRLKELHTPKDLLDLVEQAKENSVTLLALEEKAMDAAGKGEFATARSLVFGMDYDQGKKLISKPLIEFDEKLNALGEKQAKTAANQVTFLLIVSVVSLILLLASVLFTFMALRKKLKPLAQLTDTANLISQGDLRVEEIETKSKDEVAQLTRSINTMVVSLRNVIGLVNQTSESLAASSEQVSASAEQTSSSTSQVSEIIEKVNRSSELQLKNVEDSFNAVEDMTEGIAKIAESSSEVEKASEQTSKEANVGNSSIEKTYNQMNTINDSVTNTSKAITLLERRSREIGEIVKVITEISSQTNLLALNAAIEAARAGEHGKGFAVVADEVRKLAEQSAKSANQITDLISAIQADTVSSVEEMNIVMNEVNDGIDIVKETGEVFKRIFDSTQNVASQIKEVSDTAHQIAEGANGLRSSFQHIQDGTRETAAGFQTVSASSQEQLASMEEISSSAEALSELAQELRDAVQKFKL